MADIDLDPKVAQKIMDAFGKVLGIGGARRGFTLPRQSSSGYGNSSSSNGGSTKSVDDAFKAFSKMVLDVNKKLKRAGNSVEEYEDALDDFNKALRKSASNSESMLNEIDRFTGELHQLSGYLNKHSKISKMFTSTMGQANAHAAMMSAAFLDSHEYVKRGSTRYNNMMENLEEAISPLSKSLLSTAGVLDSTTGQLKRNLRPSDFSAVRASLGALVSSINDGVSAFGANSLRELMDSAGGRAGLHQQLGSNNNLKNALLKTVVDAAAKGVKVEVNTQSGTQSLFTNGQLNEEAYNQLRDQNASLAKAISTVSDAAEGASAAISKLDSEALKASSAFHSFNKSNVLADLKDKFSELGEASTIAANLGKTKAAFGDLYKEIVQFNAAMVPETYVGTHLAAVKLGMSFDETVKFMQENKRMMAIYGADGFGQMTSNMKATFQQFGLNMAQAADAIAPMTDAAINAGVNIRDADAMDKFVNQTMESYKKMAGVVDMTAAQYAQMNAQLLNNEDIQSTLIGMDAERSQAYAKDTIAVRDHYIKMGLSADSANELLLAQRRQARESVIQRVGGAARAMLLAQQTGMSQTDAQELFTLSKKGIRTADEDKRLAELQGQVGLGIERSRVAAYDRSEAAGYAQDAMIESLTSGLGAGGDAIRAARELEQKKRAGAAISDAEQDIAAGAAAGSEAIAGLSNLVNSISSILGSTLFAAASASALALAGLTMQAYRAMSALRMMGGGGGGLSDMLPGRRRGGRRVNSRGVPRRPGAAARLDRMNAGRASRGQPALPGAPGGRTSRGFRPRLRGGSPASIATGLAGGYLLNEAINSGAVSEETGAKLDAGLDIAAYAGTGALVGSFIPVIGTGVGAALGGAVGLYKNWDNLGGAAGMGELAKKAFQYTPAGLGIAAGKDLLGRITPEGGTAMDGIKSLGQKAFSYTPMGLGLSAGSDLLGRITPEGGTAMDGIKSLGQTVLGYTPMGLGLSAGRSVLGMMSGSGQRASISAFSGAAPGQQPVAGKSIATVNSIAAQAGIAEINDVQDLATHHHLSVLTAKLDEAITLLTRISEMSSAEISKPGNVSSPGILSSISAISGT